MTLLIDSGIISEVEECFQVYPWVRGLSTNPKLLKLASKEMPAKSVLETLKSVSTGPFYYQVTSLSEPDLLQECQLAREILGDRLIVKIMPSNENFTFTSRHSQDFDFCFTAVHNLTQAKLAHQAGARYIAIYVNRMLKNNLQPYDLIQNVCKVFPDNSLQILAASIKSLVELETTLLAGAQFLTLPYPLFAELARHDLTDFASADFKKSGTGIL